MIIKKSHHGDFPGGPGVRTPASTGSMGSISGGGAKIPHAVWFKKPKLKNNNKEIS